MTKTVKDIFTVSYQKLDEEFEVINVIAKDIETALRRFKKEIEYKKIFLIEASDHQTI